jgi:hypothetical protein
MAISPYGRLSNILKNTSVGRLSRVLRSMTHFGQVNEKMYEKFLYGVDKYAINNISFRTPELLPHKNKK